MKAILVLENGSFFEGASIGAPAERFGPIFMDTAVVGYQEMLTDPANAGKILLATYPLIGNYGVAEKFSESKRCWVEAVVMKEESRIYSNWQAEGPLTEFLKDKGVTAISGLDTRTIGVEIRDNGEMAAAVSTKDLDPKSLLKKLASRKKDLRPDFVKDISIGKITNIESKQRGPRIAILDLGVTNSLLRQLKTLGCSVVLLPYNTTASAILGLKADGLIISNGPEDDKAIPSVSATVKSILGKIPIMGISTGHQVIAIAAGARLKRMKAGHHGVNYPVKGDGSLKGEITVQNHSFVVDDSSIRSRRDIAVTLRNIDDNSIEEMESASLKFLSVQYYPVSPGFDEVNDAFRRFLKMMRSRIAREVACAKA
jgi:carbamoyl-phosphate synthase small subunit